MDAAGGKGRAARAAGLGGSALRQSGSSAGRYRRGGSPSARDRETASRMGYKAVMALYAGRGNCVIATQNGHIVDLDMEEALQMKKPFPMERYQILESLTLSGSH